jgi:hypothetical protein
MLKKMLMSMIVVILSMTTIADAGWVYFSEKVDDSSGYSVQGESGSAYVTITPDDYGCLIKGETMSRGDQGSMGIYVWCVMKVGYRWEGGGTPTDCELWWSMDMDGETSTAGGIVGNGGGKAHGLAEVQHAGDGMGDFWSKSESKGNCDGAFSSAMNTENWCIYGTPNATEFDPNNARSYLAVAVTEFDGNEIDTEETSYGYVDYVSGDEIFFYTAQVVFAGSYSEITLGDPSVAANSYAKSSIGWSVVFHTTE